MTEVNIDGQHQERVEEAYKDHRSSIIGQHKAFVTEGNNQQFLVVPIIASLLTIALSVFIMNRTGVNMDATNINTIALGSFILLAIIAVVTYAYLIKRPTVEKLRLQSEIEGFKMYLEMAEKDRINLLNPPDRTPEHFEAMLPYAFALGVQHKWSELFESILTAAAYQPSWTDSPHVYTHTVFADDFSQSMSSSATPPSDSGGSGGGGFSGGGGGGGSVGGW